MLLNMMNYRQYNKEKFVSEFTQGDIYKQLTNDYQHVHESFELPDPWSPLPRRVEAAENQSTFYYSTFYYLQMLLEKNPKTILDVGSAGNYFKKYIPQIIGLEPDPRFAEVTDIVGSYDSDFVNANLQKYDCAMTIGAIHAVSLTQLQETLYEFGKVIKPGGRGYFAVNLRRSMQYTELHEYAELFDLSRRQTMLDLYNVVKNIFENIQYKIIALDINFIDDERNRYEKLQGSSWPDWDSYAAGDFTGVPDDIVKEIMQWKIGLTPFPVYGFSEVIDGNVKIVFEV